MQLQVWLKRPCSLQTQLHCSPRGKAAPGIDGPAQHASELLSPAAGALFRELLRALPKDPAGAPAIRAEAGISRSSLPQKIS